MATVVVTPIGDAAVNSYVTVAEAQAYWDTKIFTDAWNESNDQEAAVVMASRVLDAALAGRKTFYEAKNGVAAHFVTGVAWTGARAAGNASKLAWPRSGMTDRNGVAIAETEIPIELKDAVSELAGQLSKADRTADNDAAVQGITSIKAGPVSLSFNGTAALSKAIGEAVWDLLVPSWMTDEVYEGAMAALFDVVSAGSEEGDFFPS